MTLESILAHSLKSGTIEEYRLPDWEQRDPQRPLYVAADFWTWIDNRDDLHEPRPELGRRSVFEQIELMFNEFRCAARPVGGSELRRMMPSRVGVYKLHPPGSRVFGWFPTRGIFIAVNGEREQLLKSDRPLYRSKLTEVQALRASLGLGKSYLTGDYRALF